MSQNDMNIADQAGAAFLADLNAALQALVGNNSGATEPATMYSYMFWADTTTGLLKQRNAANTAWITIGTLASTNLGLAPANMVSLYPTVASAATMDIFGATGATIDITGTTTITGITACSAAQVGSKKTIIPSNAAGFSITASASLVVDGATSGTYLMPQNAIVEILATSTTTFRLTTIYAAGTWTPNQGAGLTVVGAFSSSGVWVKTGRQYTLQGIVSGATSIAVSAGGGISSNAPFAASGSYYMGGMINGGNSASGLVVVSSASIFAASTAITATSSISFSVTAFV